MYAHLDLISFKMFVKLKDVFKVDLLQSKTNIINIGLPAARTFISHNKRTFCVSIRNNKLVFPRKAMLPSGFLIQTFLLLLKGNVLYSRNSLRKYKQTAQKGIIISYKSM